MDKIKTSGDRINITLSQYPNNQLGRRNLQPFQRIELVIHLEEVYRRLGKENEKTGGKNKGLTILSNPHNTREEVSKLANVSEGTYEKGKKIIEKGTEEQKDKQKLSGKKKVPQICAEAPCG